MLTSARKTHVVPTHLRTPETVLSFGGLSLSARQFLLLLVGAAISYDCWKHLKALATFPGGVFLAAAVALFPALVAITFAFGRIAGRDMAIWFLVILRYLFRPKCLVWRSVRFQEPKMWEASESEDADA
ncbi:MAG TPA: hypothetical protein VFV38_12485 [Ktedonobacteraceae bacterium]|nr:hypothetical protein [Ktedonobacteraceae bacterium]